jgi:hypothetical protein
MKNIKNVAIATKTDKPRDVHGRYLPASEVTKTVVRKPQDKVQVQVGTHIKVNSSWIQTIVFNEDNTVGIVTKKAPNVLYAYKPTAKGLNSVLAAVRNNNSLGGAYNKHLRNRELYHVVFKG